MEIKTAKDAAEAYKSLGNWEYADREAAWKWMFEQGQIAEREVCVSAGLSLDAESFGIFPERVVQVIMAYQEAIRKRANEKCGGTCGCSD